MPVVPATDIGSDVDDTWALAQLLRTPELDLRPVLTEARYRASVAAEPLERPDLDALDRRLPDVLLDRRSGGPTTASRSVSGEPASGVDRLWDATTSIRGPRRIGSRR